MTTERDERKEREKAQDDVAIAGPRSFPVFLAKLGDGEAAFECSTALHRLTEAMHTEALSSGKARGELTLKLSFAMARNGQCEIERDVKIKEPKPVRSRAVAWVDKKGHLVTENPRQGKLPLRPVDAPDEDPRDVAGEGKAMR